MLLLLKARLSVTHSRQVAITGTWQNVDYVMQQLFFLLSVQIEIWFHSCHAAVAC